MDDRELDLTQAQEAVKSKYPPINKKYECKFRVLIRNVAICCSVNVTTLILSTFWLRSLVTLSLIL